MNRSLLFASAALAAVFGLTTESRAQRAPSVRGSLDAVTIIPPTTATAPANHPATLPSGHPQLTGEAPASAIPGHPAHVQSTTGALRVIVAQGTKDAPAVGKDPVKVELFSRGNILKTYHTAVGEGGIVELHELPLDIPFQPVITITHSGIDEQLVGALMHKYQPAIELDMKVYEPTTEKPAWTIGLRDVTVVPVNTQDGVALQVTELIGGYNPLDKAWTGEEVDGEKRIFTIPLPAGAQDVQFGQGLAEAHARVIDHAVIRGNAMLPGSSQYVFGYTIPARNGAATLTFTAPVDTTLFALYLPKETQVGKTDGLQLGTAGGANADQSRQLLKAKTIKSGQVLAVELSNIKVPPPPETRPMETIEHTTDLHLPVPATRP